MAAVETLRRGHQRYIVSSADHVDNTNTYVLHPVYSAPSFISDGRGNSTYIAPRMLSVGTVMTTGTNDATLVVEMLNPGDAGFDRALDAKSQLGPNWEALVEKGVSAC